MNINNVISELEEFTRLNEKITKAYLKVSDFCFNERKVNENFENKAFSELKAKRPSLPGIEIVEDIEYLNNFIYPKSNNSRIIEAIVILFIIVSNMTYAIKIFKVFGLLLTLALAGAVIYFYFIKKVSILDKMGLVKKTERIKAIKENEKIESYKSFNYMAARQTFIEECKEYDTAFTEIISKFENYINTQNNSAKEAYKEYLSVKEEWDDFFANAKFLKEDVAGYAPRIIEYLKNGRASDYKEALNLAIEESRKEAAERNRREEAERQEELLREQNAALGIHKYY